MFKNIKISTKLLILVIVTSSIVLTLGMYGVYKLGTVHSSFETVYKERVLPLKQLNVISDLYAINIVGATHKMSNGNIDFSTGKKKYSKSAGANRCQLAYLFICLPYPCRKKHHHTNAGADANIR